MLLLLILMSCENYLGIDTSFQFKNPNGPSPSYHKKWSRFPQPLLISHELSIPMLVASETMMDTWENTSGLNFKFFGGGDLRAHLKPHDQLKDYLDNVMGVYISHRWYPELSPYTLAITQYFGYRMNVGTDREYIHMVHADIIINGRDFSYSLTEPVLPGHYDFQSVLLHELGHFLGLPHYGGPPVGEDGQVSVMVPSISRGVIRRNPALIDRQNLFDKYEYMLSFLPEEVQSKGEFVRGIVELKMISTDSNNHSLRCDQKLYPLSSFDNN